MTMYFMPASLASVTHSSALYFRVEARGKRLVFAHRNARAEHDPFAEAERAFAFPLAGRNRVETPVDEETVLRLAEPLEALFPGGIHGSPQGLRYGSDRSSPEGLRYGNGVAATRSAGLQACPRGDSCTCGEREHKRGS